MNQDVTRLEELLARVQRNASQPRAGAAPAPATPLKATPSRPIASAAPAAPAFVPAAPVVVAPEPVFPPPPAAYSPPAPAYAPPPSYAPPAGAFMDSVDDLLEDPFPASSAPPPPPVQDSSEESSLDAVVATSREHISGVMPVAEIANEPPEELLEDDIVEMTPGALAAEAVVPAARSGLDDLNFDDEEEALAQQPATDEEPPASSSRSKVAGTMDEALARAAEQMEIQEGREVPLKTPPPESGPQAAMAPMPAGIHAPPAPDIDELLEADILPVQGVNAAVPTTEQLGQTIELEEARGPHLELDHPQPVNLEPASHDAPTEELEITLPQREFGGGYQDDLMPPPEARQDLDAHLQRVGDDIPPPPESLAQYPSQQPAASTSGMFTAAAPNVTTESPSAAVSTVTIEAPTNAEFSPELLARPELSPGPVAKFIRAEAPRPSTFLELLDSSLALGRG